MDVLSKVAPRSHAIARPTPARSALSSARPAPPDRASQDSSPIPDRLAAWRAIVDAVRREHAPLAATLEHAHVEEFSAKRLTLSFIERFFYLLPDDESRAPLLDAVRRAHGDLIELSVTLRFDAASLPGNETLAEQREAELARRRAVLERAAREHPVVREANQLFTKARDLVRVSLREDEQ